MLKTKAVTQKALGIYSRRQGDWYTVGNLKCCPPHDITAVANILSVGRPTLKCFLRKREERKMGKETGLKNEKMSEWEVGMWGGSA